jgi:hypothetical protein
MSIKNSSRPRYREEEGDVLELTEGRTVRIDSLRRST